MYPSYYHFTFYFLSFISYLLILYYYKEFYLQIQYLSFKFYVFLLHIISQINKSGYNFHYFFCRTIFIHTHALLRTICILYKLSTTILFYNNNCILQCFQYFSSTVPRRFITLLCVIMHILLIITCTN